MLTTRVVVPCFDLHAAAQRAAARGNHKLAAELYIEAARCALTPEGAWVLLEKASSAVVRADCRRSH